jgi:DNA repair protein RadC
MITSWVLREVHVVYGDAVLMAVDRRIRTSRDIVRIIDEVEVLQRFTKSPNEHFIAFGLDVHDEVIGWHLVAKGVTGEVSVDIGSCFRPLVVQAAVGAVFAHNHPSGYAAPSEDDVGLTRRLVKAGRLLDISVRDHVILTESRLQYHSFWDAGQMK